MLQPGERIDGYKVERMLGRGGTGVVYEAIQSSLQRRVALKVLRPELAEDPAFVARFEREARLQASIEHPHVLDVYEAGEVAPGELFLSMRLVEGGSLADLIRSGELDAARTLRLMEQAGGALDAAHAAGLLHRDVKPQNILVGDEDDDAFLADFGLSRASSESVTSSRPTVGTVAYVAPEVIRGEDPGPASDRYAFAATLFHCLTGDVVFARGSDAAVLFAHATEAPPRISVRRPELPAALDDVFARGLAKDPAQRPATSRALVASVRAALGDAVAELGPPDLAGAGGGEPETVGTPVTATAVPAGRARGISVPVLLAVALCAVALGAGVVALLDEDAAEAEPDAPVPAVARGAVALGGDLTAVDRSSDCRGGASGDGRSCAIVQSRLPGRQILVPRDGTIRQWAVRGARGELALEVIRLRGEDTVRVNRSRWESVGNAAPHVFSTDLPVERGDALGVVLGPGARIGVRDTKDAATSRWTDPANGFYGEPDRETGAGRDIELALRADLVAGAALTQPRKLTGAEASRAPDGTVRERSSVTISKPRARVTLALVEIGDRVALDLLDRSGRVARTVFSDLRPEGQPVDLKVTPIEGESFAGAEVWWVNPNSGRMIFHFFSVTRRGLDFTG